MRRVCRIFFRILAALVVFLVAAVLASPWWLRFPLRWVAERNNATFATCEINGYSRLVITGLRAGTPAADVTAARIELDTPWLLAWRRFISGTPGPVTIDNWRVTLKSTSSSAPQTPNSELGTQNSEQPSGVLVIRDTVNQIRALVAPWLPALHATNGEILFPGAPASPLRLTAIDWLAGAGTSRLAAANVNFDTHTATLALTWDDPAGTLALRATYTLAPAAPATTPNSTSAATPLTATASATPHSAFRIQHSELTASLAAGKLTAQLNAFDNTATLDARFAPEGWMPAEIFLDAPALKLTAAQLARFFRVDAPPEYASATGRARIEYRDHRVTADIAAHAEPAAPSPETPPIDIKLRAQGTREQFDLTTLDIASPGFTAHLTAPVAIARGRRIVSGDTSLTIAADLARQPWLPAQGSLTGEITLKGFTTGIHAAARLAAENIRIRDIAVTRAALNLTQEKKLTRLDSLELALPDGTALTASGQYDAATRTIANAAFAARILPTALPPFQTLAPSLKLPDGVAFDEITLTLAAGGSDNALAHSGAIEIKNARHPALPNPASLSAGWRGRANPSALIGGTAPVPPAPAGTTPAPSADALALDTASLTVATASTELRLAAADVTPERATLTALDFRKDGASLLTLDAPSAITWHGLPPRGSPRPPGGALSIAPLELSGPRPAADPPGAERPHTVSKFSIQLAFPSKTAAPSPNPEPGTPSTNPQVARHSSPSAFSFDISASAIDSSWFADLFNPGPLPWHIGGATISGRWDGGPNDPLTANINLRARVDYAAQLTSLAEGGAAESTLAAGIPQSAIISLSAALTPAGLDLSHITINDNDDSILSIDGRIPATVRPGADEPFSINRTAPITLNARTDPASPFWKNLTRSLGIIIDDPRIDIRVAGTIDALKADADIAIQNLGIKPENWPKQFYTLPNNQPFPTVSGITARLTADDTALRLENLSLAVSGQALTARGRLPFAYLASALNAKPGAPQPDSGAIPTIDVSIPDLDLAALSPYASDLIAPRGRLAAEFSISPGKPTTGHLRLSDAALRPVAPLGAVKAITADASLDGRHIKITKASALIGNQPISIEGSVDFPDAPAPSSRGDAAAASARRRQQISNPIAAFVITPNLKIKGSNIPFIREPGLLLRADLDIKIAPKAGATTATPNSADPSALSSAVVPCIQGKITPRDSIFLYDVRTLWAKKPAEGPASRPPFFSLDIAPFRDWLLDIDIRGRRFLRVQTAVFTGAISAEFKLDGTLREPRLIGEASITNGKVLFPFATFATQTAVVRLTKANPHMPAIEFFANARAIGYDLRMSVTGAADSPVLSFTSNPALTSEQILYFIMAGEPPNNETDYSSQKRALSLGAYIGQNFINELFGLSSDEGRLTLSSGEKITRQGRESYNIEYKLTNRWSAVGEYDEFDAYNFGLKWNVYTSRYRGQHVSRKTDIRSNDTPSETAPAGAKAATPAAPESAQPTPAAP